MTDKKRKESYGLANPVEPENQPQRIQAGRRSVLKAAGLASVLTALQPRWEAWACSEHKTASSPAEVEAFEAKVVSLIQEVSPDFKGDTEELRRFASDLRQHLEAEKVSLEKIAGSAARPQDGVFSEEEWAAELMKSLATSSNLFDRVSGEPLIYFGLDATESFIEISSAASA